MTAAVRAQLLAASAKIPKEAPKKPAVPLSPAPAPKEPREPAAAGRSPEKQPGPETRLIGPYALCLADPKHYPGRYRHTITGPATPGLTDALEAALKEFVRLTDLTP